MNIIQITPEIKNELLKIIKISFDILSPYSFSRIDEKGNTVYFICYSVGIINNNDVQSCSYVRINIAIKNKENTFRYSNMAPVHIKENIFFDAVNCNCQNNKCKSFEDIIYKKYWSIFIDNRLSCLSDINYFSPINFSYLAIYIVKFFNFFINFHNYKLKKIFINDYNIDLERLNSILSSFKKDKDDKIEFNQEEMINICKDKYEHFEKRYYVNFFNINKNFPVDWKFLFDFNRMLPKIDKYQLNNEGYRWFEEGSKKIKKKDGTIVCINPRKDFFYSYPLIAFSFREDMCQNNIGKIIDNNHDVSKKLIDLFVSELPNIDSKYIKYFLKIINGRIMGDSKSYIDIFFDIKPKDNESQELNKFLMNNSNGIGEIYHYTFIYGMILFFSYIPESVIHDIIKIPKKINLTFFITIFTLVEIIGFSINNKNFYSFNNDNNYFYSGNIKKLIKNTFKSSLIMSFSDILSYKKGNILLELSKNKTTDNQYYDMFLDNIDFTEADMRNFIRDVIPIFEKRVLIPIVLYIMENETINKNDLSLIVYYDDLKKISAIKGAAIRFFINSCNLSIGDMLRLNKIAHDNMIRFSESGKECKETQIFTKENIKKIEGEKYPIFSKIRSDRYRKKLGLSDNIDWYPLFDYSYTEKKYEEKKEYKIVPLLSKKDLELESKIMKHCVGYFGYNIKSYYGESRIYTIIDDNNVREGTLELSISDHKVSLEQLYGYNNSSVPFEILDISRKMVSMINNGEIDVNWKRVNEKTPTGILLAPQTHKKNTNRTIKDVCGYNFRDITSIRAAAEPWRDMLPKNLKSINPKEYKKVPEINNIIKSIKSIILSEE